MSYRTRRNTKILSRFDLVRLTRPQLESLLRNAEIRGDVSVARMIESELARRNSARRNPGAKRNSGTYGFEEGTEAAEVASAIGSFIQSIGGVPVPNRAFDHGASDEIALTVRIVPETRPYFVYGASPKGHLFRAMERYLKGLGYRFDSESEDEVSVYRDPFR